MSADASITVISDGRTFSLRGHDDRTLLELLVDAGVTGISSPCGGNGLCGKCLVRILEGSAGPPHDDERRLLTETQLEEGLRLACRTVIAREASVVVALLNREADARVVSSFASDTSPVPLRTDRNSRTYGCAIDIGTTTIVVYLARLDTGEILDHRPAMNSQRVYGGDVISRIQYASEHPNGLAVLQRTIVSQLDGMMNDLLAAHAIAEDRLVEIVAVGNPTMIHFLAGADPAGIACAPFIPSFTAPREYGAAELGFGSTPSATVVLPGFVSAYVGSDITVGLHTTGITRKQDPVLYIDIGTNGEIVLWDGFVLRCCSAAAGPAFEGASIRQGMGAVGGAVDHIWKDPDREGLGCSTIAGESPAGICGSGIMDAMALLLELGLVDETGAMMDPADDERHLLVEGPDGPALRIADEVFFTNRDVREVQLAKAAIAAGVDLLLIESGLETSQLSSVVIAGGFGSYITVQSALRIGLLPAVSESIVVSGGNCAGKGALSVLLEQGADSDTEAMRTQARYIELSTSSVFQELYVAHMLFSDGEI